MSDDAPRRSRLPSGLLWVLGSVVLTACAQLLMKAGMLELGSLPALPANDTIETARRLTPIALWVAAGLGCYGVSMLSWLLALSRLSLSLAYPMLGLSYVLVYVAAVQIPYFGESASMPKTLGTVLIVLGVALVAGSDSARSPSPGAAGRGEDGPPARRG